MSDLLAKLNCAVGDLAITVNCKLPENLGNIVLIKSAVGMAEWGGSDQPMFSWEVKIATEHGWLVYEYEGYTETLKCGPVPDQYLRRITPPQGYLLEEFADCEQLQVNFHQVDITEVEINA